MVLKLKLFSERKTEGTIFLAEEGIKLREKHISLVWLRCNVYIQKFYQIHVQSQVWVLL